MGLTPSWKMGSWSCGMTPESLRLESGRDKQAPQSMTYGFSGFVNPVRIGRNGINAISCSGFPENHPNPVLSSIQDEASPVEVRCSDPLWRILSFCPTRQRSSHGITWASQALYSQGFSGLLRPSLPGEHLVDLPSRLQIIEAQNLRSFKKPEIFVKKTEILLAAAPKITVHVPET